MTDIDFDELDKAVNSALKPALEAHDADLSATEQPSEPAKADAKDEPSASGPAVIIKPRSSVPLMGTPSRQTMSSPAAKRTGRFMDMVHPSSVMASDKKVSPAPKVKIMPTENAPKPDETPVEESKQAEVGVKPSENIETPLAADTPKPEVSTTPADETPEEIVKSDYPDPIDVAGPLSIAEEPAKASDVADGEEPVSPAPAEAPFIPDAKVEKRPLGGFTPDEPAVEQPQEEGETQLPPEAGLPAALQSDVVAVESDVLPDTLPGQADNDQDDKKESHETASHEQPARPRPISVPNPDEGAPQSIPQQYHSAPAKADEEPRPVFDTDQYHQPLITAHSGKKNHAWVFILLVLALLAVGGTLGYFAFMSGI